MRITNAQCHNVILLPNRRKKERVNKKKKWMKGKNAEERSKELNNVSKRKLGKIKII